ncbi:MAG: YfhO family protein [Saprospiraceae bacterium]|nr:YfhO family protein [Saprospiraceae bacterium]
MGIGTLLTFMLSMGDNLAWFNKPIFDYLPLYNKFRTPNSILSVTAFLVPMLGLLAVNEIFKKDADKKTILRAVYISGGILGAIALFFMLFGPSFFDFTSASDQQYVQNYKISADALPSDRKALMRSDAFRSLVLVLLSAGLVWAFLQKWVQKNIVIIGIGILVLFDMWTAGRRYFNDNNFVTKTNAEAAFTPRAVDELIKKDADPNFRVLDLSESTFQSSFTSYFHKSIGGYHAAKLQRYQDIIDRQISKNNERVLNMLNTKYYIVNGQDGQPEMQINMGALGNAWFVNSTRMVDTPNQEIDALSDFDPANEAIVHKEFSQYLVDLKLQRDSAATITLTTYEPNHLTYQSNASSEQLAVFSEIWYGPNKGWQAYVDGNPVEHIRVNYILRAMRVPAGQHKIEFIFAPKTYERGKLLSTIFSSFVLLGLLGVVGFYGYQSYQKAQNEPKPTPPAPVEKAKANTRATPSKPIARTRKKK